MLMKYNVVNPLQTEEEAAAAAEDEAIEAAEPPDRGLLVRAMMDAEVDFSVQTVSGETPLHYAAA